MVRETSRRTPGERETTDEGMRNFHQMLRRSTRRREASARIDTARVDALAGALGAPAGVQRITHALVVDDDEVTRTALRWPLEDAGYVVHEAEDGLGALHLLTSAAQPMAVLLDLLMPCISGYELLRLLAGRPVWAERHAFVVMTAVTGPFGPSFVQPLLRQLAITVVPKPFDLDDLLAAVDAEVTRLAAVTCSPRLKAGDLQAPTWPTGPSVA
jgi:CheY-like chemotaxis protein